jgi:hypothetical protein
LPSQQDLVEAPIARVRPRSRSRGRPARANGGEHIRNMPGEVCIFAIDVPLASENVSVPHPPGVPATLRRARILFRPVL